MSHCSYIHRLPHEFYASMNYSDIKKSLTRVRGIFVLLMRVLPVIAIALMRFGYMFANGKLNFKFFYNLIIYLLQLQSQFISLSTLGFWV